MRITMTERSSGTVREVLAAWRACERPMLERLCTDATEYEVAPM